MFHSKIKQLWEGIKHYGKLKSIKLNDSLNLIATLDVTEVPNLKKLVFKDGCMSLEEFPDRLKSHLFAHIHLFFFNCFKLAGRSNVLGMLLKAHEEMCKQSIFCRFAAYELVIPESEIPQWFSHQSIENIWAHANSDCKDSNEGPASAALYLDSLAVSHSSLSHSLSLAPEVVATSGRTTSVKGVSHSSLSHPRSTTPQAVTSSVVSERPITLWIQGTPRGFEDIHNVLVKNSGTRANQGLVLELPKVEKLRTKYLDKLKIITLNDSLNLIATPDFTGVPNLEKLIFNDGIAITKLPSSIEHLTNLASLHLRDCKNLLCLPSIICSFKSLKDINLAGCSKLDGLPEKLWNVESLEKLNVSGIALREPPSSVVMLENLKELSFRGCKGPPPKLWNKLFPFNLTPRRSQNPVSLFLPSLLGMCSLTSLDLKDCSLQTITNDIGNLSSISYLNLSENHFSCLPESIVQLSKLKTIYLSNCTGLRSLPQLPSTIYHITADGCTSLETFPDGVKPYDLTQTHLFFLNCFKLADNQGQSDMFLRMLLTVHQEICKQSLRFSCMATFDIFIPGSEIPKWFSHQNVGDIVTAKVTHPYKNETIQVPSRSSNMWIGIAVCVDFSSPNSLLSDKGEFLMELRFRWDLNQSLKVNKCGFRMVYKQDLEDIREMISAQSSNSVCITPYEGLDVHNDFHNSTEGIKMKRSRDEYEGAGPSGEGSSNDVPHSKRIER
nr:tmv resistance protein n [Quercus suber]